jgi:hypothetical protein
VSILDYRINLRHFLDLDRRSQERGALPELLGDSYLYVHNRLYRAVRDQTLAAGYRYSSSPSELSQMYLAFPLLSLERVMEEGMLPYIPTVPVLEAFESRSPGTSVSLFILHVNSGVFSNNRDLLERWLRAAGKSGEKMWHMPLDDEYREKLTSAYADIQNIGPREGAACSAAIFLKEFAGDTPWVHVDIAATAWVDGGRPFMAQGPTATPLGSLVRLALDWQG